MHVPDKSTLDIAYFYFNYMNLMISVATAKTILFSLATVCHLFVQIVKASHIMLCYVITILVMLLKPNKNL